MAEETGDVGSKSGISKALTKKLGPLPGYAWVGLAVGGFLVYHKLKTGSFFGSGSSSSSAAVPAGTTDTSLGAGTPGTLDTGGGGGGGSPSAGAGFFEDPNTTAALGAIEAELAQLASQSAQQQQPNPNNGPPPQNPAGPSQVDVNGNPLSGGPIYAYSGGQLVGYAPHATSAFSTSQPAASGYEALGIAPSSPITLLPVQEGPPTPVTPTTVVNTQTGAQHVVSGYTPIIRPGQVGLQ